MNIISITNKNVNLLKKFIELNDSKNFRYFNSRNVNVIKNHIVTLLVIDDNDIIGYGHLDFEKYIWLGICVLKKFRGKGYGKLIIKKLIEVANKKNIENIFLTVDKENIPAINLYKKFDFKIINEYDKYYKMCKNM